MSIEAPAQEIIVPGRGVVNFDAARVDRAVKEYDERLSFGWNPKNEDWVVYIELPRDYKDPWYQIGGVPVMPVLGVGKEIPTPEAVVKRLWETDAWRNGEEIYDKMLKHNESLKAEKEAATQAQTDEALDRIGHAYNAMTGEGTSKVYFNGSKRRRGYNVGKRDAAGG